MAVAPRKSQSSTGLGWLYDQVSGDEDARVCKDIPESSCQHLPRNFFAYLSANVLSKVADELSSARLVLPWLLSALGTPAAFIGFLVPIREAGVLVPQLFVAAYLRRLALRKRAWIVGAALSGLTLGLMALCAWQLRGIALGWAVLSTLAVYSLARGICSVTAKDVLGKTVSKTRRGRLMGLSAAASGVAVVALGLYLEILQDALSAVGLAVMLLAAATLWLLGLLFFSRIIEAPGASEGGGNAAAEAFANLQLLRNDRDLRHFVAARALLLSVALVPPFYVLLAQQHSSSHLGLGALLVSSGVAGFISAPLWGRMADRNSRMVMICAAAAAAILGIGVSMVAQVAPASLASTASHALLFGAISLCHAGVRLGRKVYLVDMATQETRAAYVAVSNTVIGCAMLLGGFVGFIGDWLDVTYVIGLLGLIAGLSAFYLRTLRQVSG